MILRIRSEFFLERWSLESQGDLTEQVETDIMNTIVERYPSAAFSQKLKVHLGIIKYPPDEDALLRAEEARTSGAEPDVYLPLYQAVIDSFPDTENSYRAKFVIAYAYEHDLGDMDTALKLYKALAEEPRTPVSETFVSKAYEKLDFYAREPEMLAEIDKYLAGFTSTIDVATETLQETKPDKTTIDDAFSGVRRIRARNARIRGRYFTN